MTYFYELTSIYQYLLYSSNEGSPQNYQKYLYPSTIEPQYQSATALTSSAKMGNNWSNLGSVEQVESNQVEAQFDFTHTE